MSDIYKTIKKYNELLEKHGDSPKALGWTKDKEFLRFQILCSQFDLEGASILDFGCGLGYFYAYLKKIYKNFTYVGIDINEQLLTLARKKFPEATFVCNDLFTTSLEFAPDYIFSSGVHNIRMEDNIGFNEKSFKVFSDLAIKGFAVNFLSDKVDFPTEGSFHNSPEKTLALAYKYSRRVILRNDYAPFEFTIFVNKNQRFTIDTVFEDFADNVKAVEDWIKP
jgi:SAM-dependent methyltransferase